MNAKRNDPCPCGSGKKFKKCHGQIEAEKKKIMRSFSVAGKGDGRLISIAQQVVQVIESKDERPVSDLPPSKASTKEAETPQLAPPTNFKPESV